MAAESTPAMTVRDVAEYLNVNEKTVYRLAQSGDLPGFKVAGAWRFQRVDLDHWIREQKREAQRSGRQNPLQRKRISNGEPQPQGRPAT